MSLRRFLSSDLGVLILNTCREEEERWRLALVAAGAAPVHFAGVPATAADLRPPLVLAVAAEKRNKWMRNPRARLMLSFYTGTRNPCAIWLPNFWRTISAPSQRPRVGENWIGARQSWAGQVNFGRDPNSYQNLWADLYILVGLDLV